MTATWLDRWADPVLDRLVQSSFWLADRLVGEYGGRSRDVVAGVTLLVLVPLGITWCMVLMFGPLAAALAATALLFTVKPIAAIVLGVVSIPIGLAVMPPNDREDKPTAYRPRYDRTSDTDIDWLGGG